MVSHIERERGMEKNGLRVFTLYLSIRIAGVPICGGDCGSKTHHNNTNVITIIKCNRHSFVLIQIKRERWRVRRRRRSFARMRGRKNCKEEWMKSCWKWCGVCVFTIDYSAIRIYRRIVMCLPEYLLFSSNEWTCSKYLLNMYPEFTRFGGVNWAKVHQKYRKRCNKSYFRFYSLIIT